VSPELRAVLAMHRLNAHTQCGAISIPVVHHHGAESDGHPGPLRSLRCTKPAGHDGPHRDCVCCYRFQTFEDWQVVRREPYALDGCTASSCLGFWPCDTIKAIQGVTP
jgi:hypothetical protein